MLSLNKCCTQFRLGGWVYLRTLGKKYETEKYKEFHGTTSFTAIQEYRTFRTKDFSHKSFSTSFGLFTQFLVVISHNNYE